MGGYTNGRFPLSMMVHLGGKHYLPAGTAARWLWMVAQALAKYGVELYITPGWNAYRPYDIQVQYKIDYGAYAAAAGFSSHGLIYRGQLVAAIDVGNWQNLAPGNVALAWARFKALCRLAGFTVDFVSPQELWHIGDFNDIWTVPDFASGGNTTPPTTRRKLMYFYRCANADGNNNPGWLVLNPAVPIRNPKKGTVGANPLILLDKYSGSGEQAKKWEAALLTPPTTISRDALEVAIALVQQTHG